MRTTFTRVGTAAQINVAVKAAKKFGANIEKIDGMIIKASVTDEGGRVEMFTAVKIRPQIWAITYSMEFYKEPEFPPAPAPGA